MATLGTGIRPATPADEPAIVDLLLAAGLRPNRQSHELHWKYWRERQDWPGSRSFVLTRAGEVLAHTAIVPGAFTRAGHRMKVIHMIDWAAREGAPGTGVSLLKYVGRLADALFAVGGSPQTLRIIPQIGFRRCGVVTGYVHPLHPLGMLKNATHMSWRVPLRLVRSVLWAVTAPTTEFSEWSTRQVGREDTRDIDAIVATRTGQDMSLERSEGALTYFLACPIASMRLYAAEKRGCIRGYFVLSHVPGQVRLADIWLDNCDPSDWVAVLQCAVREARGDPDAAELVAWASAPLLADCLEKSGFHARRHWPVQVLPGKDIQIPDAALKVQMLDSDAAFHHSGCPSLWA